MSSMLKIVPVALMVGMSPAVLADMESIADGELSTVTGQSGLTIDYSGQVSMQEFRYEDSGELVAEGIRSGGAGVTDSGSAAGYGENFDDARLTFDVASDGGLDVLWQSQSGQPIDWGFTADDVSVRADGASSGTAIFSGLSGWGQLLTAQHSVLPSSVSGQGRSAIYNYAAFTVENLSANKSANTIGIEGGYIKSPDYTGNTLDDMDLTDQIPAWAGGQRARSTTPMDDIRAGFAAAEQTVYAAGTGGAAGDTTIAIEVTGFAADIGAQNLSVGQRDLGSMSLDNLQISDTIITLQP